MFVCYADGSGGVELATTSASSCLTTRYTASFEDHNTFMVRQLSATVGVEDIHPGLVKGLLRLDEDLDRTSAFCSVCLHRKPYDCEVKYNVVMFVICN